MEREGRKFIIFAYMKSFSSMKRSRKLEEHLKAMKEKKEQKLSGVDLTQIKKPHIFGVKVSGFLLL